MELATLRLMELTTRRSYFSSSSCLWEEINLQSSWRRRGFASFSLSFRMMTLMKKHTMLKRRTGCKVDHIKKNPWKLSVIFFCSPRFAHAHTFPCDRQSSISTEEGSPVSWHWHEFFSNYSLYLLGHSPRISRTIKSGRSFKRCRRHDSHLSDAGWRWSFRDHSSWLRCPKTISIYVSENLNDSRNPFLATLICWLEFSLAWKIR